MEYGILLTQTGTEWVVDSLLSTIINAILEVFKGIQAEFSKSMFSPNFDFFRWWFDREGTLNNISNVIVTFAYALIIFNVIYHLYKTLFTSSSNAENPIKLIGLFFVGIFLISYIYTGLNKLDDLLSSMSGWLDFGLKDMIGKTNLDSAKFNDTMSSDPVVQGVGAIGIQIVKLIVLIALIKTLIKLFVLFGKRYVEFCFNYILFPLSFAALPADSTRDITKSFVRTFISSILALFISKIYLTFYLYAMTLTFGVDSAGDNALTVIVIGTIFTVAIGEFFIEVERWLNSLGLTNADMYHFDSSNVLATTSMVFNNLKKGGKNAGKALAGASGGSGPGGKPGLDGSGGAAKKMSAPDGRKEGIIMGGTGKKASEIRANMRPEEAGNRMMDAMKNKKNINSDQALNEMGKKALDGKKFNAGEDMRKSMAGLANNGQEKAMGKLDVSQNNKNGWGAGAKLANNPMQALKKPIPATFDTRTGDATIQGSEGIATADAIRSAAGLEQKGTATLSNAEMNQITASGGIMTASLGTGTSDIATFNRVGNGCIDITTKDGSLQQLMPVSSKDVFDAKTGTLMNDNVVAMCTDSGMQYFERQIPEMASITNSGAVDITQQSSMPIDSSPTHSPLPDTIPNTGR